MKFFSMRWVLIFMLMTGIALAKPPDPKPKKTESPAVAPTEQTTAPARDNTPQKVDEVPSSAETQAEAPIETPEGKKALEELKSSLPDKPANGTRFQWFGHAFIYLTSANGIRVVSDPFSPGSVKYEYPARLPADVSLVSCENADRTGTDDLNGSPVPLRSVTGVGIHVSNGLTFKGVASWRDEKKLFTNTIYVFTMDNIRFCVLGNLGYPLSTEQRRDIGKVDVLVVSAGNRLLRATDFARLVQDSEAKYIVPVAYLTDKNNNMDLRPLEEFDLSKYTVQKVTGNSIVLQKDKLPTKPTVLMLETP